MALGLIGKALGVGAGLLGLGGTVADANSQRKAYEAALQQQQIIRDYIEKLRGNSQANSIDIYQQLADQGRQYQQAALDTQYNMLGPQIDLMQGGNVAAQNYLQQALGGMNSATLGGALPQFSAPVRLDAQAYMPAAQQMATPNFLTMNYSNLRG